MKIENSGFHLVVAATLGIMAAPVMPSLALGLSDPFALIDLNRRPTDCDVSRETRHIEVVRDHVYFLTEEGCDGGPGLWRMRKDGARRRLLHRYRRERACARILGGGEDHVWVAAGQRDEDGDCRPDELWVTSVATRRVARLTGPDDRFRSLHRLRDRALIFTDHGVWASDGSPSGTVPIETTAEASFVASLGDRFLFHDGESIRTTTGRGPEASEIARCEEPIVGRTVGARYAFGCGDALWSLGAGEERATRVLDELPGIEFASPATEAGVAFFLGSDGAGGLLWVTDGTGPGTRPVLDPGDGSILQLVALGQRAVFTVYRDGVVELWGSEGTVDGSVSLGALPPLGSRVRAAGDVAIVTAGRGSHQSWISDGTPDGTYSVAGRFTP